MDEVPWIEASAIGSEAARETWALAARHVLADTAGEYHAVIEAQELADAVQQRSRVRTRQAMRYWIGDVLFRVASECQRRREPLLSSLCITANGSMGDWYADTVLTVRNESVSDPDDHAARERLDCYRLHGATLPTGGGEPARPVRLQPVRAASTRERSTASRSAGTRVAGSPTKASRATKTSTARAKVEIAPKVCDRCFTALPASGICDYCD